MQKRNSITKKIFSLPRTDEPDLVWDHFTKTPQMSTYQLALIISDFESISPTQEINEMDGRKLEIKVWGRKEYLDSLKSIPDKVVWIMNYLQDYFNSSIVLPKLDLVAVPSYGATKASDSWGLMFFKYILFIILLLSMQDFIPITREKLLFKKNQNYYSINYYFITN